MVDCGHVSSPPICGNCLLLYGIQDAAQRTGDALVTSISLPNEGADRMYPHDPDFEDSSVGEYARRPQPKSLQK